MDNATSGIGNTSPDAQGTGDGPPELAEAILSTRPPELVPAFALSPDNQPEFHNQLRPEATPTLIQSIPRGRQREPPPADSCAWADPLPGQLQADSLLGGPSADLLSAGDVRPIDPGPRLPSSNSTILFAGGTPDGQIRNVVPQRPPNTARRSVDFVAPAGAKYLAEALHPTEEFLKMLSQRLCLSKQWWNPPMRLLLCQAHLMAAIPEVGGYVLTAKTLAIVLTLLNISFLSMRRTLCNYNYLIHFDARDSIWFAYPKPVKNEIPGGACKQRKTRVKRGKPVQPVSEHATVLGSNSHIQSHLAANQGTQPSPLSMPPKSRLNQDGEGSLLPLPLSLVFPSVGHPQAPGMLGPIPPATPPSAGIELPPMSADGLWASDSAWHEPLLGLQSPGATPKRAHEEYTSISNQLQGLNSRMDPGPQVLPLGETSAIASSELEFLNMHDGISENQRTSNPAEQWQAATSLNQQQAASSGRNYSLTDPSALVSYAVAPADISSGHAASKSSSNK
eukprot:gene9895-1783_t